MQQYRSRRRQLVMATGLLTLEAAAFSPASRSMHNFPVRTCRGVAHNLATVGQISVPLSAPEAVHRPLHEENLVKARELSSLNGKYGGLYRSEMMLESAQEDLLSDGVLGFQIDDFDDTPLGDTIDIEQYGREKIKINVSGVGRRNTARLKETDTDEGEVPSWFSPIPTKDQILCLNVKQLKFALGQRGLPKTGRKAELQKRLMIWAAKKEGERVRSRLVRLRELLESTASQEKQSDANISSSIKEDPDDVETNDYAVDALTNKRKAINEKSSRGTLGLVDESFFEEDDNEFLQYEDEYRTNNIQVNQALRDQVSRTFNIPSQLNNRDLREMYIKAKFADQNGNRSKAKYILRQLRIVSPNDLRVVRRLARMEMEDGNMATSRKLLQDGLRDFPEDAHLIHGLGQLERTCGNDSLARQYFQQATETNPTFPNPYHALGTLEHSHGNIKMAVSILKKGIQHCPNNHRLHHALGEVYFDAQMMHLAEDSYLTALKHVEREWGKSFVYNSLSYVAYANRDIEKCRSFLRQSLDINDMHAQGVIALAQLEESEGNIKDARKVYGDAVSRYEKKRMSRSTSNSKSKNDSDPSSHYSPSYSGDKWINVFRSWARMEETHGNYESAHIVFSKAVKLFPESTALMTEWANLQIEHDEVKKGKLLFEAACHRAGGRSTEPYRLFAEFEMRLKNFEQAQSILQRGAQAVTESSEGSADSQMGLASLYHTWGVCERHLGNIDRAEQLFNDAIRATGARESDANIRSLILYSMARLEFGRGEYLLAQHCVGLSLKENLLPGGNSQLWMLWAAIAKKMGNEKLKNRCLEQVSLMKEQEKGGTASDLSRILEERANTSNASAVRMSSAVKDMFRRTPWYSKICTTGRMDKAWHDGARLWH